jgi:hypothetical protein
MPAGSKENAFATNRHGFAMNDAAVRDEKQPIEAADMQIQHDRRAKVTVKL